MIVNTNNTKSILTSKSAVNSGSQGVAEVLGNGKQIPTQELRSIE